MAHFCHSYKCAALHHLHPFIEIMNIFVFAGFEASVGSELLVHVELIVSGASSERTNHVIYFQQIEFQVWEHLSHT